VILQHCYAGFCADSRGPVLVTNFLTALFGYSYTDKDISNATRSGKLPSYERETA